MMRSKCEIVKGHGGKYSILVTEIPYQVNRERLIEKIAELVRDKRLDGITDLRNESTVKECVLLLNCVRMLIHK